MSRGKDIQDNKFKLLLSTRGRKKKKQPRRTWVQRIIQWRLIGYIVIGVSLYKLDKDIETLSLQMFFLVLLTELQSRGVSKKRISTLKEELNIEHDIEYSQREELRVKALHEQERLDALKSKQDIEENFKP